MATLVIYAEASDGNITSTNNTYATARAGSSLSASNGSDTLAVGQASIGTYYCMEAFLQYNTMSIDGVINSAAEFLYLYQDATDTDYTEEVRAYDWGDTLTTADWIPGANLGNYPLLSSKTVSPAAGYNEFPTSAQFISAINRTGYTRLVHHSNRHRLGNAPTGVEQVTWRPTDYAGTTQDPKLVITYTPTPTEITITGAGNISAIGSAYLPVYFLSEPQAPSRAPVATHVTVKSPTASYTAVISPTPSEATKIERIVDIDTGDAVVCQSIATELISRWGRRQVSVSGVIPLDLRLKFKEKIHIRIPNADIDEPLMSQRKEHDVFAGTTSIVCGDIILDDNELIARMLQDLINK